MNLTEKIFSEKTGRKVKAGEFLLLDIDVALGNDITTPVAINEFYKSGGKKIFDPDRIVLIPDHFTPNKDIESAMQVKKIRKFAKDLRIKNFFDVGRVGIEHVLLPEQGLVKSGDLVVGADSHTCTYGALGAFATGVGSTDLAGVFLTGQAWFKVPESIKITIKGSFNKYVSGKDLILKVISILGVNGANYKTLEFSGEGVKNISMASRFTIANMAVEAGAKTGLFPVDDTTVQYESERGLSVKKTEPDKHANYCRELEIDLSILEAQVACPFLPSNTKTVREVERERVVIDQVVIGSCTNGRIEDLRRAAAILKGKKISPGVRCLIFPGTREIYLQAVKEGLTGIFVEAECVFSTPTCGPCLGGHMGVLAKGEIALSTTNRNFVGRMGHRESEIYLASPEIAAATALKGFITHPDEIRR